MPTSMIWISYDLGVSGDYEGLYSWLDSRKAKECGDSLAVISYTFKKDLLAELKAEISKNLKISKRTRIYVIHTDHATKKSKGKFIFGGRRVAPWSGYATSESDIADEEVVD
ncbi:MAG TPA: hypothetical protein VME69_02525 [Methylocella sp.]|nr:hypothetical protein [Methylocella sp.]